MIRYVFILSFLVIAGCATKQLSEKREKLTQHGFSDDYIDGYVNGCSTGYKHAGDPFFDFSRDMPRYQSNQDYSNGWDKGYESCRSDYESLMNTFDTLTSD